MELKSQPGVTVSVNAAIVFEALILWSAIMLVQVQHDTRSGRTGKPTYIGDLLIHTGLDSGWKIALLFGILLALASFTGSRWPGYAGFMITASALMYEAATVSIAFQGLLGDTAQLNQPKRYTKVP